MFSHQSRSWRTKVDWKGLTADLGGAADSYDMCKAADETMVVQDVLVVENCGGSRGFSAA